MPFETSPHPSLSPSPAPINILDAFFTSSPTGPSPPTYLPLSDCTNIFPFAPRPSVAYTSFPFGRSIPASVPLCNPPRSTSRANDPETQYHSLILTLPSGSRTTPSLDQIHHEIAIRLQTLLLGIDAWPQTEKARDGLLVFALGRGVEFGTEGVEQGVAELVQCLRRRKGLLRCRLDRQQMQICCVSDLESVFNPSPVQRRKAHLVSSVAAQQRPTN